MPELRFLLRTVGAKASGLLGDEESVPGEHALRAERDADGYSRPAHIGPTLARC